MKYLLSLGLLSLFALTSCGGTDEVTVIPVEDSQPMVQEVVVEETPIEPDVVETDIVDESLAEIDPVAEGVMVGGAMMLPSKDIVDNAVEADNVTTLVAAVTAADLVETLKGEGPFTVFAPTDDAFWGLQEWAVENLLKPENKEALVSLLTYHVVGGSYTSADLEDGQVLTSVQWDTLEITYDDGVWMINGAEVQIADVISSNGVTHVIDTVLTPGA